MVKEYYDKIRSGQEVRANLILLRDSLKEEKNRRAFAYLLGGEFDGLCSLLNHEDPKVRRNAALILGKMESEDLLPILFDAYEREATRFVRADYLKAMSEMDCSGIIKKLELRLGQLRSLEVSPEEQKHTAEEIRALQAIVMKHSRKIKHKFAAKQKVQDVILVTNRCHREVTAKQITQGTVSYLAGGIRVRGAVMKELLTIRTWSEMLFPLEVGTELHGQPDQIGRNLADPVLQKAAELHEGKQPFVFRIELKGSVAQDKKGDFIRKISDAMESVSQGRLINSVADYELEVRLLERKDGNMVPMLKLYTLPAARFAYRRELVASSISPVNAALAAELVRPYLKEQAQILDPFCGVGTMLIERDRAVKAGTMYGIDIYGEAIEKARSNTSRTECRINYINKDFFDFEHEYLFDEVVTDMPQVTAAKSKSEIRELYHRFFEKIGTHLKNEAVLVLYATEPQFAIEEIRVRREYRLAENYTINEKNGTSVLVILRKER